MAVIIELAVDIFHVQKAADDIGHFHITRINVLELVKAADAAAVAQRFPLFQ